MRWSRAFIPTLREDPKEADAPSHRLLLRAGYIRQLMSGHYALLPLAVRAREKIIAILREEMDRIGGQEFHLPVMQAAELWRRSGRLESVDVLFRLGDSKHQELVLAPTHEEVITTLAGELQSYRDLPQRWYQIHTKFRDEARPKSGLLRVREFTMKDAYSFDLDEAGLDSAFDAYRAAYVNVFSRLGLEAMAVDASSGAMGGGQSVEFVSPSPSGEDDIVRCPSGDYAANVERATSRLSLIDDGTGLDQVERFGTPGVKTIADLAAFRGGAPGNRQIKTLVYVIDSELALVLMRGDHDLIEQKLIDGTGAKAVRPADDDEIKAAMGASPGSLGAVGVERRLIADQALRGRRNMLTGANADGFHLRGVDIERDITVTQWCDLRRVQAGEECPVCGGPMEVVRGIEVGHIFKLGRRYVDALGVTVLGTDGDPIHPLMGCYGIGVERAMAAVAERHHDDKGLVWPMAVAPYHVAVVPLSANDRGVMDVAEQIYLDMGDAGLDVILDDRDARAGVKLADGELIGIPVRVTVGKRGVASGTVEVTVRSSGDTAEVGTSEAAETVRLMVESDGGR